MKVFILASLLCMLFASCHSAPAEGLDILPEEGPASDLFPLDNAVEVNNVMEPAMPKAEAADPEVQSAPAAVEPVDEAKDEQAIPDLRSFCPSGWISLGSRCYKHFDSSMTWASAESHCKAYDSHLAGAGSYQDYNNIHTVAQFSGDDDIWIGGFYFQNSWRWIDGSYFDYTNWYNHNSGSSYPCIYQHNDGPGWVSSSCTYSRTFICVKKAC